MNYMIKMGEGGTARLPNEYQEVEYIQSSGTQYIDTLIELSSSDTIKAKFEITASTYTWADAIYGCSNGGEFFVLLMRSPTQARVGTSANQASSTNYKLNKIYDTSLTNGTYIENGTTYTFTPYSGFTNLPSCYIMFRHQPGTPIPVSAKVYSFEIVGKFNGIPCYRKADGVIGLYDTITGTFFTNAGTGTFLKGEDVVTYKSIPIGVFSGGIETSKIPNEYQEVKYIQSTGTQFIDTGVSPDNSTGLKVVFSDLAVANRDFNFIGSRLQGSSRFMINYTNGNFGYGWDSYYTTNESINESVKNTAELNFYNNRNFIANGNTLANLSTISISNMPTIYIFGQHSQNNNLYSYKVYECEITQDDLLIRKFIPCYRKSDNVIGMYDLVNDVFYTNAGTGVFGKGADVVSKINITYNALKTYNN